jgi:hypothetical protein
MDAGKIKAGKKVQFVRRNGENATGVIVSSESKKNGLWVTVNTGTKKEPDNTVVRATALTPA